MVFGGPRLGDLEPRLVLALFVEHDDGDGDAADLARDDVLVPVVEIDGIGDAALERDVAVLRQARQLAHVRRLVPLAVVDGVGRRVEAGDLAEVCFVDAADLEPESKVPQGIASHVPSPSVPARAITTGPTSRGS